MPIAPPNPPLIKQSEAYWCYFSFLVSPLPNLPRNFPSTPLEVKTFFGERHISGKMLKPFKKILGHFRLKNFLYQGLYLVLMTPAY